MARDWSKLQNDEIAAVWRGYCQTEFKGYDPLRMSTIPGITNMRLTPMEIIRLVEELMIRLEIKTKEDTIFDKESNER
jgi:hypothetical protein